MIELPFDFGKKVGTLSEYCLVNLNLKLFCLKIADHSNKQCYFLSSLISYLSEFTNYFIS